MCRALAGGDDELVTGAAVRRLRRLDFRPTRVCAEPNLLAAGEGKNFLFAFKLIEGNRKQMAIGQVAQAAPQSAAGVAGAENKRTRFRRQQRLEKTESHDIVDMGVAQEDISCRRCDRAVA